MAEPMPVKVGVLALQGSFREHMALLKRVPGVQVVEVRSKEELQSVVGLIIPGGESTTQALVAQRWGLIPELQSFASAGRPIWGTCAGMIFLAERAEGQKKGGQALLGGLDITVSRNFFGAQINSFETQLSAPQELKSFGGPDTFRAVFIRAPAVLEAGPQVQPLASYKLSPEEQAGAEGRQEVVVAVRSGVLLATAFHPELTTDLRWHQLFVEMVRSHVAAQAGSPDPAPAPSPQCTTTEEGGPATGQPQPGSAGQGCGRPVNRPPDMPVYGKEFMQAQAL
ncbi:hypothetical protein QJQ45_009565 [Haematococcus lacustris]|nr:hypothetical protein QJQ45_009565 [Haematococcus lacustris]